MLLQLQELRTLQEELNKLEAKLAKVEQDLAGVSKASKTYHELKQAVDLKQHELNLIRKQLDDSPHGQVVYFIVIIHSSSFCP